MPNATRRANARCLPDQEPRFRIAHLLHDPALRTALGIAEDGLGPIPSLPEKQSPAAGSDSAESVFRRAYCDARIEAARHDLVEAHFHAGFGDVRSKELDDLRAARGVTRARRHEALVRLAGLPAMTYRQLEQKKRSIGKFLLREDGLFRDAVARDEAY